MADFFENLAKSLRSPQMQGAMMSIAGMPFEVQAPILKQQAINRQYEQDLESQRMQEEQAQQARAVLEGIMAQDQITDQDVLRVFTVSPELGKALISMRNQRELTTQPVTLPDGTVMGYDKYTNTMRPASTIGQQVPDSSAGWTTEYEQPVSEMMAGISPRGQWEAQKAQIEANAPLTRQQIIENELKNEKLKLKQQEASDKAEKARRERKEYERTKKGLYSMLDTADQALDRLLSPKSGITSATGFIQSKFPTVRESTKEAENDIELLRSVLTLNVAEQNILKGVLSDPDMELLMKAGSGALDLNRSDETVLNELFKIKEKVAMAKRGLGIQPQQTTETKSKARLRYNPATGELE